MLPKVESTVKAEKPRLLLTFSGLLFRNALQQYQDPAFLDSR
jgi:hypothetical protein